MLPLLCLDIKAASKSRAGGWEANQISPPPYVGPGRDSLATGSVFSHCGYYSFTLGNSVTLPGSFPDLPLSLFIMSSFGPVFSSLAFTPLNLVGTDVLRCCLIMPGSRVDVYLLSVFFFFLLVFPHGVSSLVYLVIFECRILCLKDD